MQSKFGEFHYCLTSKAVVLYADNLIYRGKTVRTRIELHKKNNWEINWVLVQVGYAGKSCSSTCRQVIAYELQSIWLQFITKHPELIKESILLESASKLLDLNEKFDELSHELNNATSDFVRLGGDLLNIPTTNCIRG